MIDQAYLSQAIEEIVGQYNSSVLFPAGTVIINPFDPFDSVPTYSSSLVFKALSVSTGATLFVQSSTDFGLNWSSIAGLTSGATVTIGVSSPGVLYRVFATSGATSGLTTVTAAVRTLNVTRAVLDNPSPSVIPYSSSALSTANTVLVGPYWIGNQRSGLLHVTSTASGSTLQVQLSNEGVNWYGAALTTIAGSPTQSSSIAATGAYGFCTNGAMFARVVTTTNITSGTLTFSISFSSATGQWAQNTNVQIVQSTGGGVGNAATYYTAASNNLTLVKGSAGLLSAIMGTGVTANKPAYLKVFNASSTGAVTMGTTVPLLNIGIHHPNSASFDCGNGIRFPAGIVIAITAGGSPTDNTATAVGDAAWNLSWA